MVVIVDGGGEGGGSSLGKADDVGEIDSCVTVTVSVCTIGLVLDLELATTLGMISGIGVAGITVGFTTETGTKDEAGVVRAMLDIDAAGVDVDSVNGGAVAFGNPTSVVAKLPRGLAEEVAV